MDLLSVKYHPDTHGILASVKSGDLQGICRRMYNVFEDVLPAKPNDVRRIKSMLLDCGALGAIMTGTGSAVFGIFDNPEKSERAQVHLSQRYREVFLAQPQGRLEI